MANNTQAKGKGNFKTANIKDKLLEKIRVWLINIIIVSVVCIALGLVYLNVDEINSFKLLKGFENLANDFIIVGGAMIAAAVVLLNIESVFKLIVCMLNYILDGIKWGLKFFAKAVKSFNKNQGKEELNECYEINLNKKNSKVETEKPIYINPNCPPINLLKNTGVDKKDTSGNDLKKELLWSFQKYDLDFITIKKVLKGPSITRFIADIGDGRISQVTKFEKEIAMTLGVDYISIKPDKDGLCFEVPNKVRSIIYHRDVLMETLNSPTKTLEIPIGKTAIGEMQTLNIAKCPHILIAGQTGGGKSVCVNTIITSLILKNTPEKMKMILIDPKVVELSMYNGIPHLIFPVITDPQKAAKSLEWAVKEMERRYKVFAKAGVRDIDRYNEKFNDDPMEKIVVIIDELADLMLLVGELVEEYIQRLGQLARAAGVHLIVATQRPSADIVTGIIKANLVGRIAFAVQDNTNSRIILDQAGAEKLLGNGDGYLYTTEMRNPTRFQGSYISDEEIEKIISWWKDSDWIGGEKKIKAFDVGLKNKIETPINVNRTDDDKTEEYSQSEMKVMIYLNEIAFRSNEKEIILPSTDIMRTDIGIMKAKLVDVLNKLEREGKIIKKGAGRGSKTYLEISEMEAYDFLKKYSSKSLDE